MNKRILSLLLAALLLCAAMPCAQAISFSSFALTTKSDTVMMDSASSAGNLVALLGEATLVQVLDQKQNGGTLWYHVTDGTNSGYISSANVRLLTMEEANRLAQTISGNSNNNSSNSSISSNSGSSGYYTPLRGYSAKNGYQYVNFGSYPYSSSGSKKPILWRVLTVEGDMALLWSEYLLDCRPYLYQPYADAPSQACDFIYSAVYEFLNGDFIYKAFNDAERGALIGTDRGMAFVLNREDLTNTRYGFSPNRKAADPNRSGFATPYAHAMGCFVDKAGGSNYWISTIVESYIGNMHYDGSMGSARSYRDNIGIRVAVWVDLYALNLYDGSGSQSNPYR